MQLSILLIVAQSQNLELTKSKKTWYDFSVDLNLTMANVQKHSSMKSNEFLTVKGHQEETIVMKRNVLGNTVLTKNLKVR